MSETLLLIRLRDTLAALKAEHDALKVSHALLAAELHKERQRSVQVNAIELTTQPLSSESTVMGNLIYELARQRDEAASLRAALDAARREAATQRARADAASDRPKGTQVAVAVAAGSDINTAASPALMTQPCARDDVPASLSAREPDSNAAARGQVTSGDAACQVSAPRDQPPTTLPDALRLIEQLTMERDAVLDALLECRAVALASDTSSTPAIDGDA